MLTSHQAKSVIASLAEQGGGELLPKEIPQYVLYRLAEFNMNRIEEYFALVLTNHGRTTYHKIIGGESDDIPEFRISVPNESR